MSGILTVPTTPVAAGASIPISGSGFGRSCPLRLVIDSTFLKDVTTTVNGTFLATVVIPANVTAGAHNITATSTNTNTASISVTNTAPVPTPTPTPTPVPVTGMLVGLDIGKWGGIGAEVKTAVDFIRMDTPSAASIAPYVAAGLKVIADIVGPYSSGGVAALDPVAWAANAVALVKAAPGIVVVEVLNEPGGGWFWGSGAMSQTNANAYVRLLKTVHDAFVANFGANRPKIIASWDGGNRAGSNWGPMWWAADPNAKSYVDGVTIHPYGGPTDATASALGNRQSVTNAHNATGLPVYVTEVGWPTATNAGPTGDSMQWSETDQGNNIYNFITWARGTGYVGGVINFNYRDFGSNMWYGVTRTDGTHKPSFGALTRAARGL